MPLPIRKIIKWSLLFIASILSFVLIYLLAAWLFGRIPVNAENTSSGNDLDIYLLSNGVHTDIVVPTKSILRDWRDFISPLQTKGQDSSLAYLALGWGDKGFYLQTPTWADLKFSVAFNAAFGFSSSAIHATYYKSMKPNDHCVKIPISYDTYKKLISYIDQTLEWDQDQKPIYINTDAQYGLNDAFYEARGSYNLFSTCNTWTNRALKTCKLKASLWTPFDKGILHQYHK